MNEVNILHAFRHTFYLGVYISMTISEKIVKYMELQQVSQRELARKTGIAQSTISDWKNKGAVPPADKLPQICKVLNINMNELYDDSCIQKDGFEFIIDTEDELYEFVARYKKMPVNTKNRLMSYINAMMDIEDESNRGYNGKEG